MNELQQKLLSIYKEFKRVCDTLNIPFFAAYGTFLGAIRPKGFIPWDDDIDIFMLRDDFEKLKKVGPKIIDPNFFIQCHETENNWWNIMVKIRDNRTTAIEKYYSNAKFNQGLWIDIFPIDKIYCSEKTIKDIERKKMFLVRRLRMDYKPIFTIKGKIYNIAVKILAPSKKKTYEKLVKLSTKYNHTNANMCYTICDKTTFILDLDLFKNCINVAFEDTTIPVFANYEKVLTKMYGDWNKLPPLDKRNSGAHEISFLDLKNSYTKYI